MQPNDIQLNDTQHNGIQNQETKHKQRVSLCCASHFKIFIILDVIKLAAIMLSVIMLSIIMLSIIMLSVNAESSLAFKCWTKVKEANSNIHPYWAPLC
jgi:hypothetical protein